MGDSVVAQAAQLTEEVTKLLGALQKFAEMISSMIDSAYARLDSMAQSEVRYEAKVKFACQEILIAVEQALIYINKVDDVFEYGRNERRWREVQRGLQRMQRTRTGRRYLFVFRRRMVSTPAPDYTPLSDFIEQLKRSLAQAEQFYLEFKEALEKATTSADEAAQVCHYNARRAQREQESTKQKGVAFGTAGAAASAVLGFFTGGFAGVAVAAAGATASVGGATYVTYTLIQGYKNTEKAFRELSGLFEDVTLVAIDMGESAGSVRVQLVGLATIVDDVEYMQQRQETVGSVRYNLELLQRKFDESHTASSRCREELLRKKRELKERVDQIV